MRKKRETFDPKWPQEIKHAFTRSRAQAKLRGAEWCMTIDEWFDMWDNSGLWEERGRVLGTYYMRRIDDGGPWHPSNIEFAKNYCVWNRNSDAE